MAWAVTAHHPERGEFFVSIWPTQDRAETVAADLRWKYRQKNPDVPVEERIIYTVGPART